MVWINKEAWDLRKSNVKSDFIIDNNGDLAHLKNEVKQTFIKIKKMI